MPLDFSRVLDLLVGQEVEFVLLGGLAMVAHGSAYVTRDVDLCYGRSPQNLMRLCRALAPLNPRLRGAPPGLPFELDPPTLKMGLNFTLSTDAGDVDLLGEVTGLGTFENVVRDAVALELYGHRVNVASLEALIRAKEAAGRAKDHLHLLELTELLRLKRGG